jgi:hypothetical protein
LHLTLELASSDIPADIHLHPRDVVGLKA